MIFFINSATKLYLFLK